MADPDRGARLLVLSPEPLSTRTARRFVTGVLGELGFDDLVDTATLAVSEFVTNAALHARTPISVRVLGQVDGVRIEVSDASPVLPARRAYGGFATTGRGLPLVTRLANEVGMDVHDVGKTMWFLLLRGGERTEVSAEPGMDLFAVSDGWDEDFDWLAGTTDAAAPASALAASAPPASALLKDVPIRLWLAAQQHHDALLRELALHIGTDAHPDGDDSRAAAAESAITIAVDRAVGGAGGAGGADRARSVPSTAEVRIELSGRTAEDFAALQEVLDNGERLAAAGLLLARPGLPEIVALRDWCCEQIIAQCHGVPASPWGGVDRELFTSTAHDRFRARAVVWNDEEVRASQLALIAGDDNDRILAVSAPAAALLGWGAADLIGRRVVALIPPALREAHVTGFTRHMTNGSTHVVGIDLQLPVLRADGSELLCYFRLERVAADGRSERSAGSHGAVYVARISPVAP